MRFVAGIDGGGTKTRLLTHDLDTGAQKEQIFGAFNLNGIGEEKFRQLLSQIGEYLNGLGQCEALCIGSAGISNQKMQDIVSEAMKKASVQKWQLVGDQVIALAGALDGGWGISIVSGTGSICFGKNAQGQEARSGGWGHLIGDEGSAYGLGRDALKAVAQSWDGYGEKTLLTDMLAEKMGLDTQPKIISYVYGGAKSAVADLAQWVEQAAQKGDRIAAEIIRSNAFFASENVGSVLRQLHFQEAKVAMLGGLLENDTLYRKLFVEIMAERFPQCGCVEPAHGASVGALMLAMQM